MNLKQAIENSFLKHKSSELKYPNRFKEIHKVACRNCPSVYNKLNSVLDPETEDIKTLNREQQIESVFVCGWRSSKLCKGYCIDFNIKENDLKNKI